MPTSRWSLCVRNIVTTLEGRVVLIKDLSGSNQQELTMRRISPTHNMTKEVPSSMYSMCRRDCWLSIWGIISSATSSRGMASGDKLALSTHCRYSFLFFFLRKYFSNVASHRKHCPGFYISYSNSNEQPSQYCLNTTSQTLRIRQLEKPAAKYKIAFPLSEAEYPKQFMKPHNAPPKSDSAGSHGLITLTWYTWQ